MYGTGDPMEDFPNLLSVHLIVIIKVLLVWHSLNFLSYLLVLTFLS